MLYLAILIAVLLGICVGTITGLFPGLHINLIAGLLFLIPQYMLNQVESIVIVAFIVAMAITHTFIDFIPSIFLGAPSSDTALSVLPGHLMLLEGKGYEAIRLTAIGGCASLIAIIFLLPIALIVSPQLYTFIRRYMAIILISISLILIIKERKNKLWALILFLLSGVLGIAVMNIYFVRQPLFPLLTGLFGSSMLIASIVNDIRLPEQTISKSYIEKREVKRAILAGAMASSLCSFLPGLGAAQAAFIAMSLFKKMSKKGFLILLGAINTFVMGLSFIFLYTISKPRTGAAVFIEKLLPKFTLKELIIILSIMLITGLIAFLITKNIARFFCRKLLRINYKKINLITLIFILIMTLIISGLIGVFILLVATSLGVVAINKRVRRMHLMGCLLVPVILYFL